MLVYRVHDFSGQIEQNSTDTRYEQDDSQGKLSFEEILRAIQQDQNSLPPSNSGPGEGGVKVDIGKLNISLPSYEAKDKKHRFSTFISDIVNLNRQLPDVRPKECHNIIYPDNLPSIGIVLIYRDEWPSILLRTVYSVINNTPPQLLKEIILVDDGSKDEELQLKVAIHAKALPKVRLIRHETSRGLMMARQAGIDAVTAEIFAVMDGHIEVAPHWLEPLLARLVEEPKALLSSLVGSIDQEDFHFKVSTNDPDTLTFDRDFPFFDPIGLDQMYVTYSEEYRKQRKDRIAPLPYPVLQGMMMVMRKGFFLSLGGFDPGMRVWGSEQIEVSVKVWMCGGRVEMIPCSIVAHMFRYGRWCLFLVVRLVMDYGLKNHRHHKCVVFLFI